jgi:proline iminopeptidase
MKNIGIPHPPQTLDQDSSLPFVELEGYPFHCRVYGKEHSESMLVLHGGPGGDFRYLLALRGLADQYRIIFFDQRGCGLSPRVAPSEINMKQALKDVDAFVNHFRQQGPLHLLGHSWGGYLALQYAARQGKRIRSLILAEPFLPNLSTNARLMLHNLRHGTPLKMLHAGFRSLRINPVDAQARKDYFFGLVLKVSNPGYLCPGKHDTVPLCRAGYSAYQKLSFSSLLGQGEKKLREIGFPKEKMLMLVSECNRLLGMNYQQKIRKKLGNPAIIQIPDAGHYLFSDNPDACLKAIRSFLQPINR